MTYSNEGAQLVELLERAISASESCTDSDSSSPSEEQRAIDILNNLKKSRVSTKLLIETQVGKRLRKLSKHSNKRISQTASEIIDQWKKVVSSESSGSASKQNGSANALQKSSSNSNSSGFNGQSPPADKNSLQSPSYDSSSPPTNTNNNNDISSNSNGSNDQKSSQVEMPPKTASNHSAGSNNSGNGGKMGSILKYGTIPKIGEVTRDKPRQLIAEALAMVGQEVCGSDYENAKKVNLSKLTVDIESELWRKFGSKDAKEYKNKFRSLSFNMKDPANPDLRKRVLLSEISPSKLISMSSEEMASDKRKKETEETKKKLTEESVRGQQVQASTDQFKCGKCGHRKTTYFQLQTRSADEPMTTFVTCVNCNNRWKFC